MSSNLSSCYRVIVVNYHLYGCTEARCQTKCLQYANKYNQAVKSFQCVKADLCHCECFNKQHLPCHQSHGIS
ncbi:hypothetical protein SORBI_3005G174400 [Sorghum bicolor]|uniref:Uncharacterized protein n=1 Tax=Sorghum bicolor TaxID=4558 RepID=A0A1B6PT48_SORBI|nr:hypothetical protein SORBI_3005G174400 [Sorghum bicolor]